MGEWSTPPLAYAYLIHFRVSSTVKGREQPYLEFLAVTNPLMLVCEGPALSKGGESVAFIKRIHGRPTAWRGDYAVYSESRWNYGSVFKEAADLAQHAEKSGE
jgi:hypothetical protein